MSIVKATVVIPTHNHGSTLFASVASVLNQTEKQFEIFIVGDAVTTDTRMVIQQLLETDSRIRFFDNLEKSPRTGEVYRNHALKFAKGEIICYLCDDDLWMPNHIESMYQILQYADFAHSLPMYLDANNMYRIFPLDLSKPFYFNRQLGGQSLIALSYAAHTRKSYEKLPYGWRSTPKDVYTDFYMWQQFFDQEHCIVACSNKITSLKIMSPEMRGIRIDECTELLKQTLAEILDRYNSGRLKEWLFSLTMNNAILLHQWLIEANDHINVQNKELDSLNYKIDLLQEGINKQNTQIKNFENSLTWRVRKFILNLPLLAVSLRTIKKLRTRKFCL